MEGEREREGWQQQKDLQLQWQDKCCYNLQIQEDNNTTAAAATTTTTTKTKTIGNMQCKLMFLLLLLLLLLMVGIKIRSLNQFESNFCLEPLQRVGSADICITRSLWLTHIGSSIKCMCVCVWKMHVLHTHWQCKRLRYMCLYVCMYVRTRSVFGRAAGLEVLWRRVHWILCCFIRQTRKFSTKYT